MNVSCQLSGSNSWKQPNKIEKENALNQKTSGHQIASEPNNFTTFRPLPQIVEHDPPYLDPHYQRDAYCDEGLSVQGKNLSSNTIKSKLKTMVYFMTHMYERYLDMH